MDKIALKLQERLVQTCIDFINEHKDDEQYLLDDTPDAVGIAPYHTKKAMLQSFKERFNIE